MAKIIVTLEPEHVDEVRRALEAVSHVTWINSMSGLAIVEAEQEKVTFIRAIPGVRDVEEPQAGRALGGARPKVVTLCGSTRFFQAFQAAFYRETLKGNIVLSVGFAPGPEHGETVGISPADKRRQDILYRRKIDMSDEILVINEGGYVGESTRGEILYALASRKGVRWWEPEHPWIPVGHEAEMRELAEPQGLYGKYRIFSARTGAEIQDDCFVLRPAHDSAALAALRTYAATTENPELAADIDAWIAGLDTDGQFRPHGDGTHA